MSFKKLQFLAEKLFGRIKRPPGPTIQEIRQEGQRDNSFWSVEYPLKLTYRFGEVIYIAAFRQYIITGAKAFEYILKTHHKNFQRDHFFYKQRLRSLFGYSILTSEGLAWKHRRKMALPSYQKNALKSHALVIQQQTHELISQWDKAPLNQINILQAMNTLTLNIALKIFCNTQLSARSMSHLTQSLKYCMQYSARSMFIHPLKPTLGNALFYWHKHRIDAILLDIIDKRYQCPTAADDLLNQLIENTKDSPQSRLEILTELKSHIVTGHETTACALSWAWYLLAANPNYQQLLQAELEEVLNGKAPTLENIYQLKYTEAILQETLRLYPPIWSVARNNLTSDTIEGYDIPKGSTLILHLYALHRNPHYWESPDDFKPERFYNSKPSHPYAFLPFNAGPHTCIAHQLGMLEALIILATMGQKYRFELSKVLKVRLLPCVSLSPQNGIILYPKRLEKSH